MENNEAKEIDILKQYMTAGGERSTDISQAVLSLAGKKPEYKKQLAKKTETKIVKKAVGIKKKQIVSDASKL